MTFLVIIPTSGNKIVDSEKEAIELVSSMNAKRNVKAGDKLASTYHARRDRKLSDEEVAAEEGEAV